MRKEIGAYFLDLSKLVFGGVLLAGIMNQEINPAWLFTVGTATFACFCLLGISIINTIKKED